MFSFFKSKKEKKLVEITDQNFNDIIYNNKIPIVLDFYATWCQPCHVMGSLINRLSKENDLENEVLLGKVDIDTNPALAKKFEIRSVPTLLFICNNQVYERQTGLLPFPILKNKVTQFIEDMK